MRKVLHIEYNQSNELQLIDVTDQVVKLPDQFDDLQMIHQNLIIAKK